MPLLSIEEMRRLAVEQPHQCPYCQALCQKTYCRDCGQYPVMGHLSDCPTLAPVNGNCRHVNHYTSISLEHLLHEAS